MTIAVAVKTGSAVVFAADSKTTTMGTAGIEEDGTPRLVEQTYDNATKVVFDHSQQIMAMVVGAANVGRVAATDLISSRSFPDFRGLSVPDQDQRLKGMISELLNEKRAYWQTTSIPPKEWPGPTILLATAPPLDESSPRVWRVDLHGPDMKIEQPLDAPGIRLEGTYNSAFSLLYGYESSVLEGVGMGLGASPEQVRNATHNLKVLRPVEKLNLWAMPTQDAIDLAVFLAQVEIEMQRFLPGNPVCGGPVDVMVFQTAPDLKILTFPGKVLHHPTITKAN